MPELDQEIQRYLSIRECEETILRFTAHFDAAEFAEMERYFAQDGVWKRHEGDVCGVDALRERMAERKADRIMRHVITNIRTRLHSADHATVESYVTLYMHIYGSAALSAPAPLDGPVVVGRYKDELRRIDGRWMIQVRHPIHDFKAKA
ncbi:MAG: nuclear transport factor 2 family protein [Pseudomonadota bacterium]